MDGFDNLTKSLREAGDLIDRLVAERDTARAENAALRERLYHPCEGCPGCSSNDCPDELDVAQIEIADLLAKNASLYAALSNMIASHHVQVGDRPGVAEWRDHALELARKALAAAKPAAQEGKEAP